MIGDEAQMDTRVSLLIRLRREPTDQRAWDEALSEPLLLAAEQFVDIARFSVVPKRLVPDNFVDAYNDYVAQFAQQGRTGAGSGPM